MQYEEYYLRSASRLLFDPEDGDVKFLRNVRIQVTKSRGVTSQNDTDRIENLASVTNPNVAT
jgi:hypothetical protein